MPSFADKYVAPGAFTRFERDNLSPSVLTDYRIPVILGVGTTSKSTQKTLIRGSTTKDSIGVTDVTAITKVGASDITTDYTLGVDYSLGTGGDAGKIVWATPGTSVAGSFDVNDLDFGVFSTLATVASGSGTLVNDSYVVECLTAYGVATAGQIDGGANLAATISVTETITVKIDGVDYPVSLTASQTKANVISAINAAITSHGTASEVSSKLRIVSASTGASSSVAITITSNTLAVELGIRDSGATVIAVTTAGHAAGTYSITPRSTRVPVTYNVSGSANTAIPGVDVTIATTATAVVGQRFEIVTVAPVTAKNPLEGSTYWITVTSAKQDADYELQFFSRDEEEVLYSIYGEPDPTSGTISLAAQVAFTNLADYVGCVQLQGGSGIAHWQAAIDKLLNKDIYYVCPITSDPLVHAYVKNHVNQQSSTLERQERIGMVGGGVDYTRFDHTDSAKSLNDERMYYIVPSKWTLNYLNTSNVQLTATVNGAYGAVAVAAQSSRRTASEPLTRKQIVGLVPAVTYSPSQEDTLAAGGCLVITKKGSVYRVRHQLSTMYNGPIESKELSVVQLRDYISRVLRNNLDAEFPGTKITRALPRVIASYTEKILEGFVQQEMITDFANVRAVQNEVDPTEVDIYFEAQGVYPLNYALITFKFVRRAQIA